ncbi:hypothetical protein [Aquella oligotrophica]|uniref:Uncharacterized protein n=1 Tax=Aquella oligotrophica TaxID=2067065 RepID=A0A2I7N3T8_9NEIS|nr:hypothetical protein [Aquella oligotrophica]AUR50895.1 hypothetical protein CUN60_00780 [Aquella oligotrophica]
MFNNNEIFTSPDKCIEECDKQIEFANNIINYLQQYVKQIESIKSIAGSTKALQQMNPLNMMMDFINSQNKKKEDE